MAELKRTLGFWLVCAFILLNLVNTGIFFGVPIGAQIAGQASLLAWAALALMSIYIGMCFSELTTMFPSAGGVYEFSKQAYGRFFSFEVGWTIWVINSIATALLVIAAVEYLLPDAAITLGGAAISGTWVKIALSIAIILAMNFIAYRGADSSARLMLALSFFTVILLALIIVPGALEVQMGSFRGFEIHWSLILIAAFLLSETFYGWEAISFMAEEIVEPEKTIPRALNATTIFVAIATVTIAAIMIGTIGADALAQADRPILLMLQQFEFPQWLILIANLGIVVTFLGNAAGSVIGAPRLLMALSRDKLFIEQFSDIHPRHQTPYRAIILQAAITVFIVIVASGAYQRLLEMVVAPSIILYAATIVLVPYFRWKRPAHARPYRAPLGSWLPLLMVGAYLAMLVAWGIYDPNAAVQLRLLASFMLLSIPIYLLLTYFYDPDVLITTINRFATLNLWLENLLLPRRLRREILEYLPDARGKVLLEFGSGVGSLTKHLAEHVGSSGKVYAVELSGSNSRILRHRMEQLRHWHVEVIHDPHLISRVHPTIMHADMAVSVGNLSYIQDVRKVLKEISLLLPHRGHICFVEYIDFFGFLPNPKWLSDHENIRKVFDEAGFSVQIKVRKGVFWNYLYIYGVKDRRGVPYI